MFILGLTGSVGMGKTSAAAVFRRQKISVFDADGAVHQLLEKNGEAVEMVGEAFKGVVLDQQVNRKGWCIPQVDIWLELLIRSKMYFR